MFVFGGSCHEVSQCRRSYLSQRDLIAHIRHRHEKEGSTIPDSELQQGLRLPFINGNTNMAAGQPPISMPSASQANPLNPVMMPAMPPPAQPPIFVDANRMPILPSQPQFQPMPQPLPQPMPQSMPQPMPQNMPIPQPQYQPQAYIPHSQYQGIPQPQQSPNMPNAQPQVPRPEDMQVRTSVPIPPVVQPHSAPPPPPPPPQGEWRGGPPNQMTGNPPQDWSQQGRTGNYQTQNYYK